MFAKLFFAVFTAVVCRSVICIYNDIWLNAMRMNLFASLSGKYAQSNFPNLFKKLLIYM